MSKSKFQLCMLLQIAHRANAASFCAITSHDERVSIIEAERFGHSNACFAELVRDLIERQFVAAFQNLLHDRAGVFRINVDLPAAKRLPKNDRAAHTLTMLGRNSG